MVNKINFTQNMNMPSVHYGRAGLNARYHRNAMNAAMMRSGSVFGAPMYSQQQSFSYTQSTPTSYTAGNVLGQLTNLIGNNWSTISNVGQGIFNAVKGWFS